MMMEISIVTGFFDIGRGECWKDQQTIINTRSMAPYVSNMWRK